MDGDTLGKQAAWTAAFPQLPPTLSVYVPRPRTSFPDSVTLVLVSVTLLPVSLTLVLVSLTLVLVSLTLVLVSPTLVLVSQT